MRTPPPYAHLCGALLLLAACNKPAAPSAEPQPAAVPAGEAAPAPVDPGLAVPEGAKVYFVEPKDGAEFALAAADGKAKVKVVFGIEGMAVRPAGEIVPGTGHHHIIINGPGTEFGQPVPKNETHIHYGDGQTEAELELGVGSYELTMQFANGAHLSYGDKMRATVKIAVKAPDPTQAGAASAAEAAAGAAAAADAGPAEVAPAVDDPAAAPGVAPAAGK